MRSCRATSPCSLLVAFLLVSISMVAAANRNTIDSGKERATRIKPGNSELQTDDLPEPKGRITETNYETAILPVTQVVSSRIIAASLFSGGGSTGSSATFALTSSVSQLAVGNGNYGSNMADHGFWYVIDGLSAPLSCCGIFTGGFTGNIDCDSEGRRGIEDIVRLIDHVYISRSELCCRANGNLVGADSDLINLTDITRLIDHVYISKAETAVCE